MDPVFRLRSVSAAGHQNFKSARRFGGSCRVTLDDMIVKGHRPILALVIEIEESSITVSKAFLRSQLWRHETWTDPSHRTRLTRRLVRTRLAYGPTGF
jgi:hypothetical protein